jgi:hypothetical protein
MGYFNNAKRTITLILCFGVVFILKRNKMRKIDKLKHIERANILAEHRFMEAKGFSGDYDDKHPDAPWNELPEPDGDDDNDDDGYDGPDPEVS